MQTEKYEQTRITIKNPDSNEYILVYKKPSDLTKSIPSGKIKGMATGYEFYKQVKGFYWDTLRSGITVTLTYKDAAGLVTTDKALATEYVYLITL